MTFYRSSLKKPMEPARALLKLEELCARSEHCESELREKLRKWAISSTDADTIIRSLRRRRYVDDSRYARALVRDKYRFARWGRNKIKQLLYLKRIDPDIIDEALDEIDPEEYRQILCHLIELRRKALSEPDPYQAKMKLMRFALQRGYESELIKKAIANENF